MNRFPNRLPDKCGLSILCSYKNKTPTVQIIRITNIPNWYFERVVFPGELLLFEALLEAILEIYSSEEGRPILSNRPFKVKQFEHFLKQQLSNNIFRTKGILWFKKSPARHIFQLSGPRYDLQNDDWTSQPKNELVFIGRNLDESLIKQQLEDCLVDLVVNPKFRLPNLPW